MNKHDAKRRVLPVNTSGLENSFTIEFASLRRDRPQLFHLAVKEAEALAWQTPFPHLVLPTLIAEKLTVAARWHSKQARLGDAESSFAA